MGLWGMGRRIRMIKGLWGMGYWRDGDVLEYILILLQTS